jgi:hypothetical protein
MVPCFTSENLPLSWFLQELQRLGIRGALWNADARRISADPGPLTMHARIQLSNRPIMTA